MDKTIQIVRGLLNLRRYNRVFISKYCTSQKDGKDSSEKGGTSSDTWEKSSKEKNKTSKNQIEAESLKPGDKINLSYGNERSSSDQTVGNADMKFVDEKVEPVESEAKSNPSSYKDLPVGNEKPEQQKLEKLVQVAKIDKKTDPNSHLDLNMELKSYKEIAEHKEKSKPDDNDSDDSFASLIRRSAFIELGDPVGKLVTGEIYLTLDNDLYIDFGWKFPAVCRRPKINPGIYNTGAKVLLRIKDLELTARFLGEKEYTSLLEADCEVVHRINEDGSKYVKPLPSREM